MTTDTGGLDELSRTLAELRTAAGCSGAEAGARAGFSQAKVSRIEHGRTVPTPADVEALARAYDAPATTRRRLLALANDVRADNQRVVLIRRPPAGFQHRIQRIEAASTHIATYSPAVVPGLLQTEAYIRELATPAGLSAADLDDFVAARCRRQQLLGDPAHRFTLITTEGALGVRAGTATAMAEQAHRIIEASHLPNVNIGIIPWGAQATVFPLHGWDLYDQRAVIVGTMNATAVLNSPSDVAIYVQLTDQLTATALRGTQARDLLGRIARRYEQQTGELTITLDS